MNENCGGDKPRIVDVPEFRVWRDGQGGDAGACLPDHPTGASRLQETLTPAFQPLTTRDPVDAGLPAPVMDTLFSTTDANVYAILDAAKCTGLPELLGESGLPHTCLFQGQALDDLGDVAPWLVALRPDAPFTRHLFSDDETDPPWFLWNKELALFLHSPVSLDEVRAHFRHFTKVSDAQGKSYFFRFYDARSLPGYLRTLEPEKRLRFFGPVVRFFCPAGTALHMIER